MSLLKKNIFSNLLGQASLLLIGFVSFKYIYATLGEDGLGIIYFSLMLSSILTASLELGLTKTTIRELAGYEKAEPEYIIKLLQTFSFIYVCIYLLLSIAFIISVPLITGTWVKLTTMNRELAIQALTLIGASSLLSIPKAFLSSICVGLQRMHVNNSINVVVAILQQAGIVFLLLNERNIVHVAYWIAATNVIGVVVYIVFVSKLVSFSALWPKFTISVIVRVKQYLSRMAWVSALAIISKQIDKFLISIFLPIGVLGIYSFAYMTVTKLTLITDSIMQASFPVFSKLDQEVERSQVRKKFFIIEDVLIYGLVPIFSAMVFFSVPLVTFLLDGDKAKSLLFPILFLSIAFYLNGTLRLFNTYVSAVGKPIYIIRGIILILIVSTPISVFLIYRFGMVGAAFSWIVITFVGASYIVPAVIIKELRESIFIWVKPILLASSAVIFTYVPAWYMADNQTSIGWLTYGIFYIFATVLYCIFAINLSSGGFRDVALKYIPVLNAIIFPRRRV